MSGRHNRVVTLFSDSELSELQAHAKGQLLPLTVWVRKHLLEHIRAEQAAAIAAAAAAMPPAKPPRKGSWEALPEKGQNALLDLAREGKSPAWFRTNTEWTSEQVAHARKLVSAEWEAEEA